MPTNLGWDQVDLHWSYAYQPELGSGGPTLVLYLSTQVGIRWTYTGAMPVNPGWDQVDLHWSYACQPRLGSGRPTLELCLPTQVGIRWTYTGAMPTNPGWDQVDLHWSYACQPRLGSGGSTLGLRSTVSGNQGSPPVICICKSIKQSGTCQNLATNTKDPPLVLVAGSHCLHTSPYMCYSISYIHCIYLQYNTIMYNTYTHIFQHY